MRNSSLSSCTSSSFFLSCWYPQGKKPKQTSCPSMGAFGPTQVIQRWKHLGVSCAQNAIYNSWHIYIANSLKRTEIEMLGFCGVSPLLFLQMLCSHRVSLDRRIAQAWCIQLQQSTNGDARGKTDVLLLKPCLKIHWLGSMIIVITAHKKPP